MNSFSARIRPAVNVELAQAQACAAGADAAEAFAHLERAHVLGQASTVQHIRVHYEMLRWGMKNHQWHEVAGQVLRIVGAATKTVFGFVPEGNTGGAAVSPFKPMPVAADLAEIIERARR